MEKMDIASNKKKNSQNRGNLIYFPVIVFLIAVVISIFFIEKLGDSVDFIETFHLYISSFCLLISGMLVVATKNKVVYIAVILQMLVSGFLASEIFSMEFFELNVVIEKAIYFSIGTVVYLLGIVLFIIGKTTSENSLQKKYVKEVLSHSAVAQLIEGFGGVDNLVDVSNSGARIKVDVVDVDHANLEKLQEVGQKGVFVAGNQISVNLTQEAVEYLEYKIKQIVKTNSK